MIPGLWLNEGGQSAAGAGIDYLMRAHPGHIRAAQEAQSAGMELLDFLERRIVGRARNPGAAALLARDLHVLPEFLGNRSPYADPAARAVIAGLALDDDIESLERLFVAGLCGLAYGLADVIDAMRAHSVPCGEMVISGGAGRSPLVRQIMADTTGSRIAIPATSEPVLLGAAMLGAVAGKIYPSIPKAMAAMSRIGRSTEPTEPAMARFHAAKRKIYARMRALDGESRTIMADIATPHGKVGDA
jgi:D-ribulokinase